MRGPLDYDDVLTRAGALYKAYCGRAWPPPDRDDDGLLIPSRQVRAVLQALVEAVNATTNPPELP